GDDFYYSNVDSGYSVDNLAPQPPANFTAELANDGVRLHWAQNLEADFGVYRLYRGTGPTFVPGPSNLIATLLATYYFDAWSPGGYYKVAASDVHDNASSFAGVSADRPTPVAIALARIVLG